MPNDFLSDDLSISDDDAQFWMNHPSLDEHRHIITAETLRTLIIDYMRGTVGIELEKTDNVWFFNSTGPFGPEVIVVKMPEGAAT